MRPGDRLFRAYVALVSASGLAVLGMLLAGHGLGEVLDRPGEFAALALCAVIGEVRPVQVLPGRTYSNSHGAVTTSTSFAFAVLLLSGPVAAALVLVLATAIADSLERKGWMKLLYNAGQYTLSAAAAGVAVHLLSGQHILIDEGRVEAADVVPLVAAMVTFYLVNSTLVGGVIGLSLRAPLVKSIGRELRSQAPVDALLLGMAPVVVVTAYQNFALIPFLLLPVAAVYMSARASLEKEHQALHDSLTGLPNRALFREVVGESIGGTRDSRRSAVLLIDLDRFKEINDTLGHHIGDLLLKEVGPRLRESVREQDLIARLGGDEFAIFVDDVGDGDLAVAVAQRALAGLSDAFPVEELALHVDGSIGIALCPEHGDDVDTLLQRADVAMYAAKDEHAGFTMYSADRDPYSRRRLTLLSELRGAVERNELVLHYQPKADLRRRVVTDVEALVRWDHPELGMVPPYEFVPLAEKSGLIGPLTEYVLREAVGQVARWRGQGIDLRVSVNLSVHNLMDADLPSLVAEVLLSEGVDASSLELEITETTVMSDPMRALRVLQPLSEMGVRLSIDDFGTGYSSLAYLRQLPISEIKIDRSFVANLTSDENDAIIVRSTIELARNLGKEIVAEGVETLEALQALEALGCDYVQGYYLSRPVPAGELESKLVEVALMWHGDTPVGGGTVRR
jgi:diguanylate cyclase (GGDEF)-like protein